MMQKYILILLLSFGSTLLFGQEKAILSDAKITFTFQSKKVDGSIAGFKSSSIIDKGNFLNSVFEGSVQVDMLNSGNFLRNWALKGRKYFDADTYPTIHFQSTSIKSSSDGFVVTGQLTMKGIAKSVDIAFKTQGNRLMGTSTLFSSDFDINISKKNREANKVIVKFSFTMD